MSREFKGLIVSRLIVLISIILVPIAIFLIYNLADFDLWFSNDQVIKVVIIKILCPTVFSVSWLFFLLLFAERFSKTLDNFDREISVVPSRLKFFYGINAIYILFIFAFPLITPLIAVLSFASFAWRLTTFRKKRWEEDTGVSFLTRFMMILFSVLPVFCSISILPGYLVLASFLWNDLWVPNIDLLFSVSYALFTALAIGALIILFSTSGISEYEQIYVDTSKKQSFWHIKLLEIVLFGFFLVLDLFEFPIIKFFHWMGFVIIIFTSIVNSLRGKSKYKDFKSHFIGYIIAAVFIGSNVIFSTSEISGFLRVWSLIASAVLYISVLIYTFIRAE